MQPIVVAVSEREYLGLIQLYLDCSEYDSSMYDAIDVDLNGEGIVYQGMYRDVQLCAETHLPGLLSWFAASADVPCSSF